MMDQTSTVERNVTAFYDTVAPVISVDASGEYAVLGGLRGLNIIDLESPFKPARILHHHSQQSGTTVVRWNPKISHLNLLASTSNLNILIWNLERQSNPLIATFQAHARSVNDIAWSPLDPNRLASCDADGCVYIWDLRSPGGKPTHAFRSVAKGTAQIQWNRHSRDLLASAHENQLEIWDVRGGLDGNNNNYNVKSVVAAHRQAIYGLDWSYNDAHELLTCSEDKSVKFWRDDVEHEISTLMMPAPVWKTRYTPFGSGIVTIAKRNDPVLRLWNLDNVVSGMAADLVQVYSGHEGSVRSFAWRYSTTYNRYQLISWGDDKKLRFFRVERHHVKECGHVEEGRYASRRNKMMKRPVVRREKTQVEKYDPLFLKNDLDDLDNYDSNMIMGGGGVGVGVGGGGGGGILDGGVGIMDSYGGLMDINNGMGVDNVGQQHKQQFAAEVEEWEEWSVAARSLEEEFDIIRRHLGGVMSGITGAVVSIDPQTLDRRCIVECEVRRDTSFASAIVAFSFPGNYLVDTDQPYRGCPNIELIDGSPARFVSLHWDNIATSMRRLAEKRAGKGKRSLEILMRRLARSLARFVDGKIHDSSSLFQMEDVGGGGGGSTRLTEVDENSSKKLDVNNANNSNVNSTTTNLRRGGCGLIFSGNSLIMFGSNNRTVTLMDASNLIKPLNRNLAKAYKLNPSTSLNELNMLCTENADIAKAHRNNIANEAWSIVAGIVHPTIASRSNSMKVLPQWQTHPLGQILMTKLIERLIVANDIQTIAVISAVLQKTGLLTPSLSKESERIRHIYANLLYKWGLFKQRALLLNHCLSGSVEAEPQICLKKVVCNICTLTCKGYVAMCIFCGHGGHQKCYQKWFDVEVECPSGCGCKCKLMFSNQEEQQERRIQQQRRYFSSMSNDKLGNSSSRKSSISISSSGKRAMNEVGLVVVEDDDDDDDESSSEEEEEIEEVGQRSWRN